MASSFPQKDPINNVRVREILLIMADLQRVMGWSSHDINVAFYTLQIAMDQKMTAAEKKLVAESKIKLDHAAHLMKLNVSKPSLPLTDRAEGASVLAAALRSAPLTDEEKGDDPLASVKK
jgi:hypothetical protein